MSVGVSRRDTGLLDEEEEEVREADLSLFPAGLE